MKVYIHTYKVNRETGEKSLILKEFFGEVPDNNHDAVMNKIHQKAQEICQKNSMKKMVAEEEKLEFYTEQVLVSL